MPQSTLNFRVKGLVYWPLQNRSFCKAILKNLDWCFFYKNYHSFLRPVTHPPTPVDLFYHKEHFLSWLDLTLSPIFRRFRLKYCRYGVKYYPTNPHRIMIGLGWKLKRWVRVIFYNRIGVYWNRTAFESLLIVMVIPILLCSFFYHSCIIKNYYLSVEIALHVLLCCIVWSIMNEYYEVFYDWYSLWSLLIKAEFFKNLLI